jgi:hypothetical protein
LADVHHGGQHAALGSSVVICATTDLAKIRIVVALCNQFSRSPHPIPSLSSRFREGSCSHPAEKEENSFQKVAYSMLDPAAYFDLDAVTSFPIRTTHDSFSDNTRVEGNPYPLPPPISRYH